MPIKVQKIGFGGKPTLDTNQQGYGRIKTEGTKQQGSEEYKLKVQNDRVQRNTKSRYKGIYIGEIQTQGTKQ